MLNVGIIGAGYIGTKRALVAQDQPGCAVRIICDIDQARARRLAKECGCQATTDWRKVVAHPEIDAVVVATTNNFLATISIAAAKNKKHILCEKPLGRTLSEAKKIYQVAQNQHVVLKTGFNLRFHPALQKAHALYKQGCIGKLLLCRALYGHGGRPGYDKEWRMRPAISGGGELLDQGVHLVDLFQWFMGNSKEVFAMTENMFWHKSSLEDNAFMLLKNKTNVIASAHVSLTQWKNAFLFELIGEKGFLRVEGLGKSYGPPKLTKGVRKKLGQRPHESITQFPDTDVSWRHEWKEFVASIQRKKVPLGSGLDGLAASAVISALYRSAKSKKIEQVGGMI